ncbi:MarR family transcriptional regulator [Chloroflexia bacterium SDU3-3]|nr:MarR family transcriptional regulator [Chloroflexia bacterium SDU3-3]
MSRGSRDKQAEIGGKLVHELRQCYGLGAAFFRAAAAQIEMTDTDMQLVDLLESGGAATAGQLAHRMGLTTGTFTAILNRLEAAGLVRRERDPNDGRRVIVRLAQGADGKQPINPLFAALGNAWEELAAQYDDEQKEFLLSFLQRSNTLAKQEIARLREGPTGDSESFSAPLAGLKRARLVLQLEGIQLSLRAGDLADTLYQARFEGPAPETKAKDGVVTIRYPRRLWESRKELRSAAITLNASIPWEIALTGGGGQITAELGGLDLRELEATGAGGMFQIALPAPAGPVPIRLGGSGSQFNIRRPAGVAARVLVKGWAAGVSVDGQTASNMGGSEAQQQSPGYEGAAQRYEIEMSGSGSMVTVTAS